MSAVIAVTGSSWNLGLVWWLHGGPVATAVLAFLCLGCTGVAVVMVEFSPMVEEVLFNLLMEFAGLNGFLAVGTGNAETLQLLLL